MGKKGGRLTQIEKENDVFSINVSDDGTVRVLGARLESCNRVKRALQVFSENVDISKAQLRWLMLNKAANLKAMEEACLLSNCHVERLDSGAAVLEMVGTAEVIIKAKVTHSMTAVAVA